MSLELIVLVGGFIQDVYSLEVEIIWYIFDEYENQEIKYFNVELDDMVGYVL